MAKHGQLANKINKINRRAIGFFGTLEAGSVTFAYKGEITSKRKRANTISSIIFKTSSAYTY
jgi:hypothetical protein